MKRYLYKRVALTKKIKAANIQCQKLNAKNEKKKQTNVMASETYRAMYFFEQGSRLARSNCSRGKPYLNPSTFSPSDNPVNTKSFPHYFKWSCHTWYVM